MSGSDQHGAAAIVAEGDEVRLSFSQEQLWFLQRYGERMTAYNQPRVLRLRGRLHPEALERAFRAVIDRHAVLRTRFFERDGVPMAVVLPSVPFSLDRVDLSEEHDALRDAKAAGLIQQIAGHLFDLGAPPLLVARLIALGADEHVLAICTHHIVSDGWSTPIIAKDLSVAYRIALHADGPVRLPALPMQYADYAVQQRASMEAGELERDLDYWNGYLGPEVPSLDLTTDRRRPSFQSFNGRSLTFTVDGPLDSALRAFCRRERCTPFVVLLAAWQVLLARYGGQDDFAIGVPHAGRQREELFDLVGFFVNTQVYRVRLTPDMTLGQVCRRVRADAHAALAHAELPFELLLTNRIECRDVSRSPLFQVFFGAQSGDTVGLELDGASVDIVDAGDVPAKFELSLNVQIGTSDLRGRLTYNSDLFEAETATRLVDAYVRILGLLIREPDRRLVSVSVVDDAERARVLQWGTGAPRSAFVPVHQLIASHAASTPATVAVTCEGAALSYAELSRTADALASRLVSLGVRREGRVGIAAERSVEWLVGVLAILRAGGVFVPLDPALPTDRLQYQIRDSGAALVLAARDLPWTPDVPVVLLSLSTAAIDTHYEPEEVHADQSAYVIYTSGSTGRPKGVVISHGSLANYVNGVLDRMRLTGAQSMAMVSTVAADLGHTVLFGALCAGRTLHLLSADRAFDPQRFAAYLRSHRVDVVKITPSHLQALLETENPQDALPRRLLILGGEPTSWHLLDRIVELRPELRVLNHYGPTETTVGVLTQEARDADRRAGTLPIGGPLAGSSVYVLDADLNVVPIGGAGELYVAGAGLARGYHGRAAMTAERLVADPFGAEGGRLYRTGDLVRWRADGQLEYLGRVDHQVKVRGFRIELGEIEARLLAQPSVREAIVIAKSEGTGARLVAYVTLSDSGSGIGEPGSAVYAAHASALREQLARVLPDYMIPSAIVVLDALPLTPNGKVDRRALPEAERTDASTYEPPEGEVETGIAAIWADVLGVPRIGRRDHFFELGGHSLLALRLLERLRREGYAAPVRALFQYPVFAGFVHALTHESAASAAREIVVPPNGIPAGCTAIRPEMLSLVALDAEEIRRIEATVPGGAANIQDIYPLAPLQEGVLFHHLMQATGDAYVTSRALGFESRERLEQFIVSFNAVIARHDILRTAVVWEGLREPVQVVYRRAAVTVQWLDEDEDGSRVDVAERLAAHVDRRHYRIDVRQAPMIQAVAAFDGQRQRWLLQVSRHHLVSDHTTLELVVREIAVIEDGRAIGLPEPIPFRRFVAQARLGVSQAEHEAFFRAMLGDVDEPTTPFHLQDVHGDGTRVAEARHSLDAPLAQRIRRQAQHYGVSAATLFHLAWALVLSRTSGRDDVVFGTVLFGRMQGGEGVEHALGMFINTLPLRVALGPRAVDACLRHTHATLAELVQHEHATLSLAQRCSAVPSGTPLFSALLNYRYSRQHSASRTWRGIDVLEGEERTNYPFVMSIDDLGDGFALTALVHESIEAPRVCGLMQRAVGEIVDALEARLGQSVADLSLTTVEETRQFLAWGVNQTHYADAPLVHRQFERQVVEQPQATAVIVGDTAVSYDELNWRSNRLAHHLVALGIGPETRVALAVTRSVEMVVSLLAVLKTGAAYVPLDPAYPLDRLAYMIEDSGARLLLTQDGLRARLPLTAPGGVLSLDALDLHDLPDDNLPGDLHPQTVAYVIYTSGSTGQPKGVAVAHGPLAMHVRAIGDAYAMTAHDRELQFASIAFDIAHERWLVALCSGAASVLWDAKQHSVADLVTEMRHRAVSTVFMPPAYVSETASVLQERGERLPLRLCVVGGEAWQKASVTRTKETLVAERLVNAYGPTETVIAPTAWQVDDFDGPYAPIGRPIGDRTAWVLDAALNPVPVGAPGELHLGGVGLARGYLRRVGLTAERFVADPFDVTGGGRLYRTGDLVRWRNDGQLEYLGRLDQQVKIRGFRVEPGEVETQLLMQPTVREAVVVATAGPGGARLVAYVSAQAKEVLDPTTVRGRLADVLPDYMVPAVIVVLNALPLGPNGKVDRRALPEPEWEGASAYEPPQGTVEERLAGIWVDVLGVERVGRHDNFFELGGDSILSLKVAARARGCGIQLGPRQLFEQQTIAALAQVVIVDEAPPMAIPPAPASRRTGPLPLSFAQRRQWFLWQFDPASTAYHIVGALRLEGTLDVKALTATVNDLVERHEALRTLFRADGQGQVEQVVEPHAPFEIPFVDLSALGVQERDAATAAETRRVTDAPFDLTTGPLLRMCVIKRDDLEHVLVFAMHHIVSDGWSMHLVVDEFLMLYRAHILDERAALAPLPIQYADYAVWQSEWLRGSERDRQLKYWTTQLGGEQPILQLPADHPRRSDRRSRAARYDIDLPPALVDGLGALARREGTTLFVTLLAALQVLLNRHSGQRDIRVGVAVANRHRPGTEGVVGFFVNTQVWRSVLDGRTSLEQALAQTKAMALGADAHQDLPFEQLVEALHPDRRLDVSPLFQVMFNHLRDHAAALADDSGDGRPAKRLPGLSVERYATAERAAQFELTVNTTEDSRGRVHVRFVYAADLFEVDTIARMARHYVAVLQALVDRPEQTIAGMELLTAADVEQLTAWGSNRGKAPRSESVHGLFERQARMRPYATALVCGDEEVTYERLNTLANCLAHRLLASGVTAETKVGIAAERSVEMIVGLLAILKAGGVYVPLDMSYPSERLDYMIRDSGIALVLARRDVRDRIPARESVPVLIVDVQQTDEELAHDPGIESHGDRLAYVIYTSGSTGTPKGVEVTHRAIVRLVDDADYAHLDADVRMLQFAPLAFDASTFEIWGALCNGGVLVQAPAGSLTFDVLAGVIARHRVDTAWLTAALFNQMLDSQPGALASLRQLLVGGEALSTPHVRRAVESFDRTSLINGYGPTECTTFAACHLMTRDEASRETAAIGRPIAATTCDVLDEDIQRVPQGVPGELYLGGAGLARGYLRHPGLTAERFVANPFDPRGSRLYRTGDLVRWRHDGRLEYLGRLDQQVKIRGFRIEVGEVEAHLLAQPGVREAAVVSKAGPGGARLVAYVSTESGAPQIPVLRERLAHALPDYMIPDVFVTLDRLPLNPNGKVARRALPEPEVSSSRAYEPPQGATEERLAAIWAEVLGVERVGRHDNFFELGGHSLLALQLIERVRRDGHRAQVRTVFQWPELAAFVRAVTLESHTDSVDRTDRDVMVPPNGIPAGCEAIEPSMLPLVELTAEEIGRIEAAVPGGAANIQDIYPLAPLQEGILFHHLMQPEHDAYVTLQTLSFESRERLDRFVASFNQVIARHDILRTAVVWEGLREPVQVVYRRAGLQVRWRDEADRTVRPADRRDFRIDVRRAPMIDAVAAHDLSRGRWTVWMPCHHLVIDHATLAVIVAEIELIQQGRAEELPEPVPFRRFVAQARFGVSRDAHEAFFRETLGEVEEPTAPFGLLDVQGDGVRIQSARQALDSTLATRIRTQAQRHAVGAASLFHLAWALLVAKTSGRDDVVFGTVLFGRMEGEEGTTRALGLFINTLPVRITLGARTVDECLRRTHATLADVIRHEHAGLSLAQRCSAVPSGTPLFSALLNYRHGRKDDRSRAASWEGMEVLGGEESTNYPFAMSVDDLGHEFAMTAMIHETVSAERVCGLMVAVLTGLVDALEARSGTLACDLDVMPTREMRQLAGWSAGEASVANVELLHRLVERQVGETPDATAVVSRGDVVSYGELNRRANRLAHRLIALGIHVDDRVGIAMERSVEMVVALLGVLKAGAAYVPLDPEYPRDRLAGMLEDSGVGLLLTQRHVRSRVPHTDSLVVLEVDEMNFSDEPDSDPVVDLHGENLVYVIYTSGSTGKPKGVANRHRSLVNRLAWGQTYRPLDRNDVVLQKTPFGFDISFWEFFWPLSVGATLAMAEPGDHRDPARIVELIHEHRVTTIHFVPSMLQAFLAHDGSRTCAGLKRIICSGEAFPAELRHRAFEALPHVDLFNLYGPTEAAIEVTCFQCRHDETPAVPIGRPIHNVSTHVLDDALQPVPRGVTGELYLGGIGLARGYVNRAGLTAERFVADPFDSTTAGRLYRTGDRVRWSDAGQLEYLGRVDHQVKVRGFRIELGEIEAQLLAQPSVREAVVIAKDGGGGAYLLAYVSARAGATVELSDLREQLVRVLPEFMVPSAIVVLDMLPLTPNGKVDRRALPEPERGDASTYEPPEGDVEARIAEIWADVLGVARVGRRDHFFELGGHSLLALRLLERLRREGYAAPVRTLFQHPVLSAFVHALAHETVSAAAPRAIAVPPNGIPAGCTAIGPAMLPLIVLDVDEIRRIEATVLGGAANIQDIYPLAPLQEGILFHHLLQRQGDAYVTSRALAFDSRERMDRFLVCFNAVIARHDILRTAVVWEGLREPVQVVYRHAPLQVQWLNELEPGLIAADADDVASRMAAYVHGSRYRVDVRRAPMIHALAAYDSHAQRWLLHLPSHHLVLDHTTLELVVREIALIEDGRATELPEPIPFRRFVAQARLGVSRAEHEAFFRTMLGGVDEPTTPFHLQDVHGDGTRVTEARHPLDEPLARRIRRQARRHGVSAATLFHLAWALVLSRASGRDDVVFGTVLFGRMQGGEGAERALGMFINTLPLRIRLGTRSVEQSVRQTHDHLTELLHHEHASLVLAQRCSAVPGGTPLFSALLNYRYGRRGTENGAVSSPKGVTLLAADERTNYPFGMAVDDLGDGFVLSALIHESIDARQVCDLMHRAISGIVDALDARPAQPVCGISLATIDETRQLKDWGINPARYADVPLVHRQIEQQAVERPDATALIFGDATLSYRALNRQANRLAHHLVRLGVGPETTVGVAVPRSIDMVVSLLAVLKTGAAYVPLDPAYPLERLAYMVEDSGVRWVLTHETLGARLPLAVPGAVVVVDTLNLDDELEDNLCGDLHPQALAYIIYTSGSTGRPKGVAVAHGPLAKHVRAIGEAYGMTADDRELQFASIAFDGAHERTWVPLSFGAVLMPRDDEIWSAERTAGEIARHGITIACFTPSYLVHMAELLGEKGRSLPIRSYTVGGEPMPRAGFELVQDILAPPRIINGYGPTETVITPTIAVADPSTRFDSRYMPIGRVIGDRSAYVLDADMNLLPWGVPGELYLGGEGVARGYTGRPDLTAERFVADPFGENGARLYRTGDRARWNRDGQLEYLGRVDHQVKIRGFRIELGEVEAQLLAQPGVGEAVAIAREGTGETQLVAYVAPRVGCRLDAAALRTALGRVMPAFMVPAAIMVLETLPTAPNGKVDRAALPAPHLADGRPYEPPRGEIEDYLAKQWADVLGVERVGRHDDFFELGGHSLSLLKVQTRVQHELGLYVPLRTYFEKTVLSDLGAHVALEQEKARTESAGDLDRMAALLDALEN